MQKLVVAIAAVLVLVVAALGAVAQQAPASSDGQLAGPRAVVAEPQALVAEPQALATGELTGVVTIIVDDMDDFSCAATRNFLPRSHGYLVNRGTCYQNTTTVSPVCCPSRAAYMTGQYPHNNGVRKILDGKKLVVENSIQDQLRTHGVETNGDGKFLNGVSIGNLANPEYDTGFTVRHFWKPRRYTDYDLVNENGEIYTPKNPVHTSVRTGTYMLDYVRGALERGQQFYAYEAFTAPHAQHVTPQHRNRRPESTRQHRRDPVPRFRYNPEHNADDKLPIFRHASHSRRYYERWHIARVRSLYDVDDQVARLFALLDEHDVLDTTAVFFTSDNGLHLGRNNFMFKGAPYAASLNVPLLAYLPGTFAAGRVVTDPVNLIDLAPTIYELFEIDPPTTLDGHSLLGGHVRTDQYFELASDYRGDPGEERLDIPNWAKYAKGGRSYIEFYDDQGKVFAREFYADASEERNLLHRDFADRRPSQATLAQFRQALLAYQACSGTTETASLNPCP